MANSISYHFHVGAHDVYPTLLGKFASSRSAELAGDGVHIVDPEVFRDRLRPAILGKSGTSTQHVQELSAPTKIRRFVCSAHGILCSPRDILTAEGLYAWTSQTLENLRTFFSDTDLTIHLFTPPQHDFPPVADMPPGRYQFVSWVWLVDEIMLRIPDAKLVVWPVENKVQDSVEFVEDICGLTFARPVKAFIRRIAKDQRSVVPKNKLDPMGSLSVRLDEAFHQDMELISRMDDVKIGYQRARNEFSNS